MRNFTQRLGVVVAAAALTAGSLAGCTDAGTTTQSATPATPAAPAAPAPAGQTVSGHVTLPRGANPADYVVDVLYGRPWIACYDGGAPFECAVTDIGPDGNFETPPLPVQSPTRVRVGLRTRSDPGLYRLSSVGGAVGVLHFVDAPYQDIDIATPTPDVPLTVTVSGDAAAWTPQISYAQCPFPDTYIPAGQAARIDTELAGLDESEWGPTLTRSGSTFTGMTYRGLCHWLSFVPPDVDPNAHNADWRTMIDGDPATLAQTHFLPADKHEAAITFVPKTTHVTGRLLASTSVKGFTVVAHGGSLYRDNTYSPPDGRDFTLAQQVVGADGKFDLALHDGYDSYQLQVFGHNRYLPGSVGGADLSYLIDLPAPRLTGLDVKVGTPSVRYVVKVVEGPSKVPVHEDAVLFFDEGTSDAWPRNKLCTDCPGPDDGSTGAATQRNGTFTFDAFPGDVTLSFSYDDYAHLVFVDGTKYLDTVTLSPSKTHVTLPVAWESDDDWHARH